MRTSDFLALDLVHHYFQDLQNNCSGFVVPRHQDIFRWTSFFDECIRFVPVFAAGSPCWEDDEDETFTILVSFGSSLIPLGSDNIFSTTCGSITFFCNFNSESYWYVWNNSNHSGWILTSSDMNVGSWKMTFGRFRHFWNFWDSWIWLYESVVYNIQFIYI